MKTKPLWLLTGVVLVCGYPAEAQQTRQVSRVGVLISTSPSIASRRLQAFEHGLRELGHMEGKNLVIEYRYAEGKPHRYPELAAELIGLKLDLIMTDTSLAIEAVKNATKTIPVVFTSANDPLGDRQVVSLAKPGGNLTGFSLLAPDLNAKRLELLKETVPNAAQIGFLTRMGTAIVEQRFKEAEADAQRLGLQLLHLDVKNAENLERAFEAAKHAGAKAILAHPSTFIATNRTQIIELALKHRMPVIYSGAEVAAAGGLMSYGPDIVDNYRRAAIYVDKILKGTKPGDLPVEQPKKFEFVINLKTAKQIGLTIPASVLARADRVIK